MKKEPFVSVIIPTLNREEILCQTISKILEQQYSHYEIIVIDQSDNHKKETNDFLKKNQEKIKYFAVKTKGTTLAKNFGLRKANGEIILFLDDDILPQKDLITTHVSHYQDEKIGGVAGRVEVQDDSMVSAKEGVVGFVTKDGRFFDNFSSHTKTEVMTVIGCNASFRATLLKKINGFDENFTGNAMREESDLSFRVRKLGYKLVFDPKASIIHLKEKSGGSRQEKRIQWYEDFFRNEMLFFMKHLPHQYLPLRIINKARPILSCMFYYGKGSPKALLAPWKGFIDGYKLYKREVKEHSPWL